MLYLNIPTEFFASAAWRGSDPVERGTWSALMGFCAIEENGGRIDGARHWKDRKWQQLTAVTRREALAECSLWHWEGDDLVLPDYPVEKEAEVIAKRRGGKEGAARRWGKREKKSPPDPKKPPDSSPIGSPISEPPADSPAEPPDLPDAERNGTERNVSLPAREGRPPPTLSEIEAMAEAAGLPPEVAAEYFDSRASISPEGDWHRPTVNGHTLRVTNVRQDLVYFARNCQKTRQNENHRTHHRGSPRVADRNAGTSNDPDEYARFSTSAAAK